MAESEGYLGMAQSHQAQGMLNVGAFSFLSAHELAAGREVVEKRPDLHLGTGCCACFLHGDHFPSINDDLRGGFGFSFP